MNEDSLDPDEILRVIEKEEKQEHLGRLKIFFGMAAGVGKTYAMLCEAQEKLKEGVNVIVAVINTHGRKETEALLAGLPIISEKWVTYKDTVFKELDLDQILELKPELVLVDELAHTNIPGSKHPKRWQDVIEILDAGIDVFTTLNVQHIESRKEIVEGVTGIPIRENVPDLIFERAAEIELIDISPTELLHRLKEGKVYLGDQSLVAAENFFKEDRLTALRELALRFTAEKVEHDLHGILSERRGWKTRERLMVAISPNIASQQLIRASRRLAFELDATWIVVFVDTGELLNNVDQSMLNKHFDLARDLGAEVIATHDLDIAAGLHRIAKQKEITRIVIGRPHQRKSIKEYFQKSLFERLAEENEHADILVLRQDRFVSIYQKTFPRIKFKSSLNEYWISILTVGICSLSAYFITPLMGYKLVGYIFLLGILILSLFVGQGPVFLAALLSALTWGIFFIPPLLQPHMAYSEDFALVVIFFCTATIVGILTSRMRKQDQFLEMRNEKIVNLYEIVRDISRATNFQYLRLTVCSRLQTLFKGEFDILTKNTENEIVFDSPLKIMNQTKEHSAAMWAFQKGKMAGRYTNTLPSSDAIYFPVKYAQAPIGVLIFHPQQDRLLSTDEMEFLQTVAEQLGIYLERYIFEQRVHSLEFTQQVERLHEAIFNSLSSGLYTPLDKMVRIHHQLKKEQLNKHARLLINEMENSTEDLKLIFDNVLTLSKLESGFLRFEKKKNLIKDLINECILELHPLLDQRPLVIGLPDEDIFLFFDFNLMKLALNNLIINALEYSPHLSPIEINVKAYTKEYKISVKDEGKGIPSDVLPFIFDKFYRIPNTQSKGVGLGLSIVKAVVEIHGGRIKIKNRKNGGTDFTLIFPIKIEN